MKFPKSGSHVDDFGWFGTTLPAHGMVWCPGRLRASNFVCSRCHVTRMLIWVPPRPRKGSPYLTPCDNKVDGARCGGTYQWVSGHALPS
jgi:hypothetical protein